MNNTSINSNGVANGFDSINLGEAPETYEFMIGGIDYGYFTMENFGGDIQIAAPYGVYMTAEDLDEAPSPTNTIYSRSDVVYSGYYYIIRPDSLHFAKLYILSISYSDSTTDIPFQWWLQTNPEVRTFR